MRTLDSIVNRFVDDLVGLVREATADGLRTLLADEARRRATRRAVRPARGPAAPTIPAAPAGVVTTTADLAPPAPSAEITDPQWLLGMGPPAPAEVVLPEVVLPVPAAPESEAGGPPSGVREVASAPPASPVRLRPNETLARVSGAGVVIRRAR